MTTARVDREALAWLAGRAHDRLLPLLAVVRTPDPKKVAEAMGRLQTQLWTAEFFESKLAETAREAADHEFFAVAPRRRAVEAARKGVEWEGGSPDSRTVLWEAMRRLAAAEARLSDLKAAAERQETDAQWSRDEYDRILTQYPKDVADEADRRVRALPNPYFTEPAPIQTTEARYLPSGQILRIRATRRVPAPAPASAPATPPAPRPTPGPPAYASTPAQDAPAARPSSGAWWPMSALAPGFGVPAPSMS
jgi:hypothetical protein